MLSTSRVVERVLGAFGGRRIRRVCARDPVGPDELLRAMRDECGGGPEPITVLWPTDDEQLRRAPGELVDRLARRYRCCCGGRRAPGSSRGGAPLAALAARSVGCGWASAGRAGRRALPAGWSTSVPSSLPELEAADVLEPLGSGRGRCPGSSRSCSRCAAGTAGAARAPAAPR